MEVVFGHVNIKEEYLQSGPIQGTLYVRPPQEIGKKRGIMCKLKKIPYEITEEGRQ